MGLILKPGAGWDLREVGVCVGDFAESKCCSRTWVFAVCKELSVHHPAAPLLCAPFRSPFSLHNGGTAGAEVSLWAFLGTRGLIPVLCISPLHFMSCGLYSLHCPMGLHWAHPALQSTQRCILRQCQIAASLLDVNTASSLRAVRVGFFWFLAVVCSRLSCNVLLGSLCITVQHSPGSGIRAVSCLQLVAACNLLTAFQFVFLALETAA